MGADTKKIERLTPSNNLIIPKSLLVIFSIALFSLAGTIGIAIYKEVPVEIWGLKMGKQMARSPAGDVPFLLTEVKQLKEQRILLDKRLAELHDKNENNKNQLKECNDKLN
jgi:predicted transcriptional regulator